MGDVEDVELELASSNKEIFESGVFVADEGFAVVENEDSLFEVFESFDGVASTDDVTLSVVEEEVLWCGEVVFGQVGPLFDVGGDDECALWRGVEYVAQHGGFACAVGT